MPVWAGAFPISEYADMLKKIFNSMNVATSRALIFSLAGSLVTAPSSPWLPSVRRTACLVRRHAAARWRAVGEVVGRSNSGTAKVLDIREARVV